MNRDANFPLPVPNAAPRLVAVIDVGASSLRMQIAEIRSDGSIRKIESFSQALSLGKDSFTRGKITKETIENCVHVLAIYRAKLDEYGIVDSNQIRMVATSAVKEAGNRLAFQDRIFVATGFELDPFDEAELHRVTYLGLTPYMESEPQRFEKETLVVEVGGGTTETLWLSKRDVTFAKTFRLGGLRLRQRLEIFDTPLIKSRELMEQEIRKSIEQLNDALKDSKPDCLIVMGSDVRFAAEKITQSPIGGELIEIKVKDFEKFIDKVLKRTPENLVTNYRMSLPDAQLLGPGLLTQLTIAKDLGFERIHVANINLRDGLLKEMSSGLAWSNAIQTQIIRSATQLARKYHFREEHSVHVAELACKLFDQLQVTHELPLRFRGLLHIAALLHEIGEFISSRSRHKHSLYLINNSELFGVGAHDRKIIGLIVRYHRGASPSSSHDGYSSLSRDDRVAVAKLASILRIAIALNSSHKQRVQEISCKQLSHRVEIVSADNKDFTLEELEVREAGKMFEDIFGKPVVLTS
jgi:exopolyphosphatase/guanosine-5'-triphosphate,3'-diphosphate pyrophosphatase